MNEIRVDCHKFAMEVAGAYGHSYSINEAGNTVTFTVPAEQLNNIFWNLRVSAEFRPYGEAGMNTIRLWALDVANVPQQNRTRALDALSRGNVTEGQGFVRSWISSENVLYFANDCYVGPECESPYEMSQCVQTYYTFITAVDRLYGGLDHIVNHGK